MGYKYIIESLRCSNNTFSLNDVNYVVSNSLYLLYFLLFLFSLSIFSFLCIVDLLYEKVGSNTFSDFTDAQELLDAMPSARKIIQSNIGRFLDTEEGILLLQDMALAALK
jgi:hypothetical protein